MEHKAAAGGPLAAQYGELAENLEKLRTDLEDAVSPWQAVFLAVRLQDEDALRFLTSRIRLHEQHALLKGAVTPLMEAAEAGSSGMVRILGTWLGNDQCGRLARADRTGHRPGTWPCGSCIPDPGEWWNDRSGEKKERREGGCPQIETFPDKAPAGSRLDGMLPWFPEHFPGEFRTKPGLKNGVGLMRKCRRFMLVPVHFQPSVPSWVTFCCRSSSER